MADTPTTARDGAPDLILHQGNQWGNHNADAIAQQGWNLIAQRLAAAGRHQHQGIATARHDIDDLGLLTAKG